MTSQQLLTPTGPGESSLEEISREDPDYLTRQLVTYIGNKRALLEPIREAVESVCEQLGVDRLRILDAFSGSGAVSRLFKRYAHQLVVNDIEDYARVISACYLTNRGEYPVEQIHEAVERLNDQVAAADLSEGFIERLYAPRDDRRITPEDRVFYTRENARRLDTYRRLLDLEPADTLTWLLGPLLSAASVHANTAGVFKGFYKDRTTGCGRFGGSGENALSRIRGTIALQVPVLSRYDCTVSVYQEDANELIVTEGDFDLAYFDPPYNQHPYGSNYFMLNLLVEYIEPLEISKVSGIPIDWRRSRYNSRPEALRQLSDLITYVDASFVLLSYNDEGFIPVDDMRELLDETGTVEEIQLQYSTFRGSRNLRGRSPHVTEHIFLLDKRG
jgi:adenine-specific DNA-methyltransferase